MKGAPFVGVLAALNTLWRHWLKGSEGVRNPLARYGVLRPVAAITLIAFTSLTTLPVRAAVRVPVEGNAASGNASVVPSADEKYSELLDDVSEQSQRAKSKRKNGKAAPNEVALIRSHKHDLEALEADIDASFARTGADLQANNLPQVIQERHSQTQADFKARQTQFKQLLQNIANADDSNNDSARDAAVDALLAFFAQYPQGKTHTPVDPNNLPFGNSSAKPRPPAADTGSFPGELLETRKGAATEATPIRSAKAISKSASAPPTPADLAATEDAQITQQIRNLAADLGNNPVKIYNWVRNNIEFVPTYGSIQGSDLTLTAKRGNAFDTASLLIALYRAANIPARYVYGTIEVPIAQVMNWVGGVSAPNAALSLLGQGGVPNVAMVSGGTVSAARLEHVWVEAYVDYVPSRGAVNRNPTTWVPMDPSFKQYQFSPAADIRGSLTVDISAVKANVSRNVVADPQYGSVTGFDQTTLNDLFESVKDSLGDTYGTQPVVSNLIGGRQILASNLSTLAGALPYKVITQVAPYASLPATLRHRVVLNLYQDFFGFAFGQPASTFSVSLPALSGKRLGVTYPPASAADATALQNFRDSPSYSSLPLYLVNVAPTVQIDGVTQTVAPSSLMGQRQYWEAILQGPNSGGHQHMYPVAAGDELVFGIDGNGVTQDVIHKRFTDQPSDTAAENLYTVALYYWAQYDALNQVAAAAKNVAVQRLPSIGLFSNPLQVAYWFGIPRSGTYGPRQMDISHSLVAASRKDGGPNTVDFVQASGTIASFLEGRTFDSVFKREPGSGVSAIQLLREANEQRIPIYYVTASNASLVIPRLRLDAATLDDISSSVQAGRQVIVPETAPLHGNWKGVGYIVEDAQTGAGAYLINGGLSGGSDDPCDPDRKKEPVRVPILEMLLIALIILAILAALLLFPEIIPAFATAFGWAARLGTVFGVAASAAPAYAATLQPGPGDGMQPPGDCTFARHRELQDAVDQYCHGIPSCRFFPSRGADCTPLRELKEQWRNCALARTAINNTCFRGGNIPHRQREIDDYNGWATCECRMVSNGCAP